MARCWWREDESAVSRHGCAAAPAPCAPAAKASHLRRLTPTMLEGFHILLQVLLLLASRVKLFLLIAQLSVAAWVRRRALTFSETFFLIVHFF